MTLDFTQRVILITGGSSGIGLETARLLLSYGGNVAICGRNIEKLEQAIGSLQPVDAKFLALQADVTRGTDVDQMVLAVLQKFGKIDMLVNCAGAGYLGSCLDTTDETIERLFAVNVFGTMRVCRAVLPQMIDAKSGHVVNLCGILGVRVLAGASLYAATKHALVGFGGCLAQEVKRSGVKVTSLCCSGVDTPFWEGVAGKPRADMLLSAVDVANEICSILTKPTHAVVNQVIMQHVSHQV